MDREGSQELRGDACTQAKEIKDDSLFLVSMHGSLLCLQGGRRSLDQKYPCNLIRPLAQTISILSTIPW